jgi:hypothetical protein
MDYGHWVVFNGNAYSQTLIKLNCLSSDKTNANTVIINISKNTATVNSYSGILLVNQSKYLIKYRIDDAPPDINFVMQRSTGVNYEVRVGHNTTYFKGRCYNAKNKS